jgi:histidyl-tRNA synthetase
MSEDNRTRFETNPLRMLDSKDERDKQALANAPRLVDHLCDECRNHFNALQKHLRGLDVKFELDTSLVRGFDYYTKTAFEIVSPELGAQNVIGGGGRYDGLVEECGGPPTPGIGFGIGTERCLIVLDQLGKALELEDERPMAFVAPLGEAAKGIGVQLVSRLRRAGISADMDYAGRSLKSQMRQADKLGAHYVAIIGEDELAGGFVTLKNLREEVHQSSVPFESIATWILNS